MSIGVLASAQLSAQLVSGGIAAWSFPLYVAHRGGANNYPELTREAFDYAVAAGHPIELDVVQLSDGDFAVIHDTTMDRTTTTSGNVSSINRSAFLAATCDASSWWGTAPSATLMTLDQVLDRYGRSTTYFIELKQGSASDLTTLLDGYSWASDYVVLQSFTRSTCEDFVASGYESMLIVDTQSKADANTGASLLASGINYVGVGWRGSGTSASTFTTYVATGITVAAWTINTQSISEYVVDSLGVDIVMSDDPVYNSGETSAYIRSSDPWSLDYYWPGHQPYKHGNYDRPDGDNVVEYRGVVDSGVLAVDHQSSYGYIWQGWAQANGATTWAVDLDLTYTTIGNSARWAGVQFCMEIDRGAAENTMYSPDPMNGYLIVCRADGRWTLYKGTNGSYSSLAERTMSAMSTGYTASVRIAVTPSGITVTRTDVAAPNTITSSDTAYRGEYLALRRNSSSFDHTLDVEFENMTISR